ncbi:MAG TPA: hypothetical protein VF414_04265 [Thermoanaerobaculia bacterium]
MKTSTSFMSLALIVLTLAACASGSAAQGNGIQVTVLLYSGRPNPTFTLTAEQADHVRQLVAAAQPDSRGGSVLPSILGYNGLLVRGGDAGGQDLAVYDGRIEVQDREGKRVVSDGGALESFLLEAATESKALDAEQLRAIQASRDKQKP